jgi:NitT/TauT family transport system permease protein/taurine transport system permease protein
MSDIDAPSLAPALSATAERPRWQFDWRLLRTSLIFAVSLGSGIVAWKLCSAFFFNPRLLPPPETVFATAWETLRSGELLEMVWVSLLRILIGFAIGCVAGIGCGLLMGTFGLIGEFLDPLIEVVRPISPVAMIPIAIVWFGIGENSKFFIIAYGAFFVTLINTIAGVRQAPLVRLRAATCLGAGTWNLFFRITLPSAMPYINTGMRVALGGAFMSVIAAEMIAANSGIGYFILQARLLVQTERIFVGLLVLGVTGCLADRVYRYATAILFARYLRRSA